VIQIAVQILHGIPMTSRWATSLKSRYSAAMKNLYQSEDIPGSALRQTTHFVVKWSKNFSLDTIRAHPRLFDVLSLQRRHSGALMTTMCRLGLLKIPVLKKVRHFWTTFINDPTYISVKVQTFS